MKMHVLAAAVLGCSAGFASATAILYEPFNYTAGTGLNTQSPDGGTHKWADTNTANANVSGDILAASGNLAVPDNAPAATGGMAVYGAGTYSDRINTGTHTTGNLFYSYSLKVTNLGTLPTATAHDSIAAGFNNATGTQTTNPGNVYADLWIGAGGGTTTAGGTDTGDYQLGISINAPSTSRQYDTTKISLGDTVFVVGEYSFGIDATLQNATANLWFFDLTTDSAVPAAMGTPNATAVGTGLGSATASLASFLYYSVPSNTANRLGAGGVDVDELRIGTTWSDVVVVPEPASLSLLGLGAAGLLSRRQRRSA